MTQSDLIVKSLLFYFLPKLAIYLPLAWLAVCFWWADSRSADQSGCLNEHQSEAADAPVEKEELWYQSLLGGSKEQVRPGSDWL